MRSFSTTMPPRAQLMRKDPFFIIARTRALNMPFVCSLRGEWMEMKSAARTMSSNPACWNPSAAIAAASRQGSVAITFMPNARARLPTMLPTWPHPIRPSVLPRISIPLKLFLSHFPAFIEASARGRSRARANIIAIASSPAASALPPGVFRTTILRSEAAFTSMLSTPAPALPMTFSALPAVMISRVACVAERTTRPRASPISAASFSG